MRFLLTSIALILFSTILSATDQVDVRLAKSHLDYASMTLYVNVDIKNSHRGAFSLAGQNYRFFYDSETLSFSDSQSDSNLSSELYSDLKMVDHKENIVADKVNQLDFDDNLGFINFSIDLIDHVNGGVSVESDKDWLTVATLAFQVKDAAAVQSIVWGREGKSDEYATAFAEVSQWFSAERIQVMEISEFQDFNEVPQSEKNQALLADMSIGPNPAIEFVKISFDNTISDDMSVIVRDVQGREMTNKKLVQGDREAIIEVADWASASYFVEISSASDGVLHRDRLSIIH